MGEARRVRPGRRVTAELTWILTGGAEGIRTPDLLIANETRYQLRHSPEHPHQVQQRR